MNSRALKKAMKEACVSDHELAERAEIHITLVRRYLDGAVNVGAKNAIKIARVLGVSVEQVLYG